MAFEEYGRKFGVEPAVVWLKASGQKNQGPFHFYSYGMLARPNSKYTAKVMDTVNDVVIKPRYNMLLSLIDDYDKLYELASTEENSLVKYL